MQFDLRLVVLMFFAMSLFAGLGHIAVAANTMAVEMSVSYNANNMVGMDCEQDKGGKACDVSVARCATGCLGLGVDMPRTWKLVSLADNVGNATAIHDEASGTGINRPPGLPPPRTLDIA